MKFKVGDRVKNIGRESYYGICLGDIGTVIEESSSPFVKWDKNKKLVAFNEEELELVYTYEDLKKAPIGTKITFEEGNTLVKTCKGKFENESDISWVNELVNLEDEYYGKIIKIEEPEYKTVYESKVEILDEAEKRYLKGVIRPYENDVIFITKFIISEQNAIAKITIKMKNLDGYWYIGLPPFKKDTMYKNMEDDKEYTLEELGL